MIELFVTGLLIFAGYVVGRSRETRHTRLLEARETEQRTFPVLTLSQLPEGWTARSAGLVRGEAVMAFDYYKVFYAGVKTLFGGRIESLETLLDRARRESMQRMIADARRQGYDAIIRVRIETASLSQPGQGKPAGGVSVLAYGTGIRRA
jgi:uncharacterized protein YbjQ (UPF0145 family)